MRNITSIGIENFRVFDKMTTFKLAPITLLTGANNTGKSSFLKILKLLKETQDKNIAGFLDITKGNNIITINNLKYFFNFKNESNIFKYEIEIEKKVLVSYAYEFINDSTLRIKSFSLKNVKNKKDYFFIEYEYYNDDEIQSVNYNISLTEMINITSDSNLKSLRFKLFEGRVNYDINLLDIKKLKKKFDDSFFKLITTIDFIKELELEIINKLLNRKNTNNYPYFFGIESEIKEQFFMNLKSYYCNSYWQKNEIKNKFSLNNNLYFQKKYPLQYDILKEINLFDYINDMYFDVFLKPLFELKVLDYFKESYIFPKLRFINVDRASQERMFLFNGTTQLHKLLTSFVKCNFHNSHNMHFVNLVLKEMDISDECYIDTYEFGTTVKIKKEKYKIDLADCGFGVTQIFILAISMVLGYDSTIVLEEPEANLHPKLQSKLADIIALGQKHYNNHFIIETHSEYLIRKFQYLTAKKDIKTSDTLIYYFNNIKSNKEKLTKIININEDGTLSDDFGPGFLDEADNIAMDLYKFQRSNKN